LEIAEKVEVLTGRGSFAAFEDGTAGADLKKGQIV
jgi:hypothetical protein